MRRLCGTSGLNDVGEPMTRCTQPADPEYGGMCRDCAEETEVFLALELDDQ